LESGDRLQGRRTSLDIRGHGLLEAMLAAGHQDLSVLVVELDIELLDHPGKFRSGKVGGHSRS
jgi:hypothetical protein